MRFRFIIIPLLLILGACGGGGGNGGSTQPPSIPPPSFTSYFGSLVGQCADFDFPQDNSGVHYCVRSGVNLPLGQTVTLTFTISGSGQLRPLDPGETLPATLHLIIWRSLDNLSCVGAYQQFRFFAARVEIKGPGTYTTSARIAPEAWSDCYGQPGSANPALFSAALGSGTVGYTFGGSYFAGHGLAASGPVHFHLDNFSVGGTAIRRR